MLAIKCVFRRNSLMGTRNLFVLFFAFFLPVSAFSQSKIQPHLLREDFEKFREKTIKHNPGLYKFISQSELHRMWDSIELTITQPLSDREFSHKIIEAIIPVQERHLSSVFHKKSKYYKNLKAGDYLLFPFAIKFTPDDDKAVILRNVSNDSTIQHKSKLISINGRKAEQIKHQLLDKAIADNEVENWKYFELNGRFPLWYNQFIDTSKHFKMVYETKDGQRKTSTVKGLKRGKLSDTLTKLNKKIYNIEKSFPAIYDRYYDTIDAAYLRIKTFNRKKIRKGDSRYNRDVRAFFEKAGYEDYRNVIIDLRGNSGGSITYLLRLLSYFQNNTDKIEVFDRTWYRTFGYRKPKSKPAKSLKRKKPGFNGNVYILIDGGSYSASVTLTSLAKEYANVTIVGTESGGRYDGTTAGSFYRIKLKNSGLVVRCPHVLFDYYVTFQETPGSIVPDHIVYPEIDDYFSIQSDAQLNYVLNLIKRRGKID